MHIILTMHSFEIRKLKFSLRVKSGLYFKLVILGFDHSSLIKMSKLSGFMQKRFVQGYKVVQGCLVLNQAFQEVKVFVSCRDRLGFTTKPKLINHRH